MTREYGTREMLSTKIRRKTGNKKSTNEHASS